MAGQRPFLEAVQDEFHAGGNAQLVEYFEQIISDDLLLARGWSSRAVALATYAVTALMASIGLWMAGADAVKTSIFLAVGAVGAILAGIDSFAPASNRQRRGNRQATAEILASK